ncbi:hypothetical protein [Coraliomargarita parva]|uniref:hypothetical protein n=1 Tax=Coraliomargarita parva TaxID=3014050 RepID=UPI0022B446AC|nr:hypothetical protein [Coraliomargarita parva]
MKDFEEFKASREQMDPSMRDLSEQQWQQAYAAYRRSREMMREGRGGRSRRSRSAAPSSASTGGSQRSSHSRPGSAPALSPAGRLKRQVREASAYADVRALVNLLAWISIGVLVGIALLQLYVTFNAASFLMTILTTGLQVLGVLVLRMLSHVLIDIPDVTLFRMTHQPGTESEAIEQE